MEYIWLVFILLFFVPILQRKATQFRRQRHISRLENKRDSRMILLVHRQEAMKLFGFPIMRYIDVDDAEEILKVVHMTGPEMPLDLVLHTPGGLVLPSLQIARAVKHHRGKVTAFVPHLAMSGGTLIALAADEIVMADHAVLGPVDPQINNYPAASIRNVVKHKSLEDIEDETLILEDVSSKAVRQLRSSIQELLPETMDAERKYDVADTLSRGSWTHDYPLHAEAMEAFGLNVNTDMPEEVFKLMTLYPQPSQSDTVEYTPLPRTPRRQSGENDRR